MRADATKRLFTVDEYYQMAAAGILKQDDRVELVEGEIVEMSPIGPRHAAVVDRANALFASVLALFASVLKDRTIVRVQNPYHLNIYNHFQPDITLLKPRKDYYALKHPMPQDVLLAVEVADTTLRFDLKVKLPIYARTATNEVWLEDLQHDRILVYRDPVGTRYQTELSLLHSELISPLAFPEVCFKVGDLLG